MHGLSSKLRMQTESLLFILVAAMAVPRLISASSNCGNCGYTCCEGNACWCCHQILPGNPGDPSNNIYFCTTSDVTSSGTNTYCFEVPNCQERGSKVSKEEVSRRVIAEITMAMKSQQRDDSRQLGELCLSIFNSITPTSKV